MVSHQAYEPTRKQPTVDQKNRLKYVDKLDYSNIEFPISVKQDNKN